MTIYDELINFHRTKGEFDKALYFCRQALRFAQKEDREDTRRYGDAKDRLNEAVRIYQLRQNFSSRSGEGGWAAMAALECMVYMYTGRRSVGFLPDAYREIYLDWRRR